MESKKVIYDDAEYTVFEDGRILNSKGRELKWSYNRDGYPYVNLRKRNMLVHRLVALAFVPNPHGYPIVDHKDSNRKNPHASNLDWVTPAENNHRAAEKGAYRGENHSQSKLRELDVVAIKCMAKYSGLNARQIAEKYPVSQRTITYILNGERWKHVTIE